MTKTWLRAVDTATEVEPSFVVHGGRCRTTGELFTEWAASLGFPPHFGRNWDAFADSLTETAFGWPEDELSTERRPLVLLVEQAGDLLANEPDDQLTTFLTAVHDAAVVRPDDDDAGPHHSEDYRMVLVLRDGRERIDAARRRLSMLGWP